MEGPEQKGVKRQKGRAHPLSLRFTTYIQCEWYKTDNETGLL